WSSLPTKASTPLVIAIVAAVLGAAFTLTVTYKPPEVSVSATRAKTAFKPRTVPPVESITIPDSLSQANQQEALPPLPPITSSWDDVIAPLASNRLHNQKRQRDFKTQRNAGVKRSPQQESNLTSSTQAAVNLQTSSALPSFVEVALKLAQELQSQAVAQVNSPTQLHKEQVTPPVVETNLTQNQQESAPEAEQVKLTLQDVIVLAGENNRTLKQAYLERIAQRQDLAVADNTVSPNLTPPASVSVAQFRADGMTTSNGNLDSEARMSVKIPTERDLSFGWLANKDATLDLDDRISITDNDSFSQTLQLRFDQPLFREAGVNVNTASIEIAQLTEQSKIVALKSTPIDTIMEAILGYREVLQAQEQVKMEQRSLELAQQTLEANRALIEAGSLAPVVFVQSKTAVANHQLSLLTAQNHLAAAKLALLDSLDIDQDIDIVAAEIPTAKPTLLEADKLEPLAFEN
ncbi:MAG: TolC family protein, partial [Coleofasciculus sp. S288]|nr:TolC family protein [Coleofasciculus sp. S288]